MMKYMMPLLIVLYSAVPAAAEVRTSAPPAVYLKSLFCKIVERTAGADTKFTPLADTSLNTSSARSSDYTFNAPLDNGSVLTARVQHVYVNLPRDRFNVTILLNGKPHLRMNHLDLDIYLETAVDGRFYVLHCFQDSE